MDGVFWQLREASPGGPMKKKASKSNKAEPKPGPKGSAGAAGSGKPGKAGAASVKAGTKVGSKVAAAKPKSAKAEPVSGKPTTGTKAKAKAKVKADSGKAPAAKSSREPKPTLNGKPVPPTPPAPTVVLTGPASLIPVIEPIFDPPPGAAAPKGGKSRRDADSEDEGVLRSVMSSLASIFGGKDELSDAELDALLDDKMASGEIPPSAALDPLDEAQSLIYEAWNSQGPQRVRLAHRALETCPDCADAYVILAEEEAQGRARALELFRQGVEAAERTLDPAVFRNSAGRFWEIMETRPYMRARLGLAECLWELGKKDEAVGHLRELMRLNPADNQGVRYILAQCLLETGADEELGDLLERFREDASPQIRYSHALWMFRHEGPGRKASALLAEAVASNPHVPAFLLGREPLPKTAPGLAEAGSLEEAAAYVMGAQESWHKTLGAVDWLAENI